LPPKGSRRHWNRIIAHVTQPAADTIIAQNIVTGISPGTKVIMLIKKICFTCSWVPTGAAAPEAFVANIRASLNTEQGLVAVPLMDDNGTIYFTMHQVQLAADGATVTEAPGNLDLGTSGYPFYVEFEEPIPVADSEITFYFNSTGMFAALEATLHIWYDTEPVSLEEALQILESYR